MALFTKRLTCFYCGKHPAKKINGPIANLKFHCEHCDADNYLDQNGEITDPPTEDTNPPTADAPFESVEFSGNQLFCSTCLRNQHLYTSSLAAFYPEDDETLSTEYDSDYEKYRRELELRYPQVCQTCEPRVKQQMRQAGYEAKADNLRRMMDRTRAFKANQRARERSWQSLLVYLGSLCFWCSIFGQLAWDIACVVNLAPSAFAFNTSSSGLMALMNFSIRAMETHWLPSGYFLDPSFAARTALIMGCLSIWWNPKLRMKVVGRLGRLSSLNEYYRIQLISILLRAAFWSLFKDPSASGINTQQCVTGHLFMILFTVLCVCISRWTVKYEPGFLVNWSDKSWERIPLCSPKSSPSPDDLTFGSQLTPKVKTLNTETRPRFPFEKLSHASASAAKPPAFPTPPPDANDDDMDWTPVRAQVIQPTVSVHQRDRPSVFAGPNPFHGNIPPVSKPPAWNLRTGPATQGVAPAQSNPFHRAPIHSQITQNQSASPEPVFQPPRFFPQSDYQNDTGLEVMFDRAFSFGPGDNTAHQPRSEKTRPRTPMALKSHEVRLKAQFSLLLITTCAWIVSWNLPRSASGNYVETFALGVASFVSGHSLLEALGKPFEDLPGYEIAVNTIQLIWSVYHMLMNPIERVYFEPLAIPTTLLLLIFMLGQSGMRILTNPRALSKPETPNPENERQSTQSPSFPSTQFEQPQIEAAPYSPTETSLSTSFRRSNSIEPPLSFGTTAGSASFSSALPPSNYQLASSRSLQPFSTNYGYRPQSPPRQYHNGNGYSDYEEDSDTETVASSATNLTTATNRNIRYGFTPREPENDFFSPRRNELSPGLGGLSLGSDQPTRRMTRSQTQQDLKPQGLQGRLLASRTRR